MKPASTVAALLLCIGCDGGVVVADQSDGGPRTTPDAAVEGIGDPCTPEAERDPSFTSFGEKELTLETQSPSCKTGVCLVNHFRGRVSCPYGQTSSGTAPKGAAACKTANGTPVTAAVAPQCRDRTASRAVYCSCRCANQQGRTDDGARYCACTPGFTCTSLVTSIGVKNDDIAGSYCMQNGTAYDRDTACNVGDCEPSLGSCQ